MKPKSYNVQLYSPELSLLQPLDALPHLDRVDGFLLIYDTTDRDSLDDLLNWWKVFDLISFLKNLFPLSVYDIYRRVRRLLPRLFSWELERTQRSAK